MTRSNQTAESDQASMRGQTADPDGTQSPASSTTGASYSTDGDVTDDTPESPSAATGDSDAGDLPLDQVFEILKNERRRRVLQYLWEHDGESTLGTLAEHIAALENDTTVSALSSAQRKRVYVGLYQSHLPKMADNGVIEFDKDRGTVRIGKNAEQTRTYLEDPQERPWGLLTLGSSLVGAGLLALSLLGGAAYGLSSVAVATLVIGATAGLGIWQLR